MKDTTPKTAGARYDHNLSVPLNKPFCKWVFSGKVREIYETDFMFFETSDRISVFDVIVSEYVPYKGNFLNCISQENKKMLESRYNVKTDYIPAPKSLFEVLAGSELCSSEDLGKMACSKKLDMIPLEIIVRGYLTGSAYKAYKNGQTYCGYTFPKGMKDGDKLERPIVTPTTKAKDGHEKPVTHDEAVEEVALYLVDYFCDWNVIEALEEDDDENMFDEKAFDFADNNFDDELQNTAGIYAYDLAQRLVTEIYENALFVFEKLTEEYEKHDILLVDSKFEYGLDEEFGIYLADEVGTPDSSRFTRKSDYEKTGKLISMDKQKVRDYCKSQGFSGDEGQPIPELPVSLLNEVSETYLEVARSLYGDSVVLEYV